jgi:hypothetical protein
LGERGSRFGLFEGTLSGGRCGALWWSSQSSTRTVRQVGPKWGVIKSAWKGACDSDACHGEECVGAMVVVVARTAGCERRAESRALALGSGGERALTAGPQLAVGGRERE